MEIKTKEDIKHISKNRTNSVTFKLKFISDKENSEWEKKFNGLLCDCGCTTGQRYLLFFTPIFIVIAILLMVFSSLSLVIVISTFIAANIITGIIGKIDGLRRRNKKIKELIDELYNEVTIIV